MHSTKLFFVRGRSFRVRFRLFRLTRLKFLGLALEQKSFASMVHHVLNITIFPQIILYSRSVVFEHVEFFEVLFLDPGEAESGPEKVHKFVLVMLRT